MDALYLEALATLETAGGRKTIKGPKGEDSFNLYNIKDFSGKGYRALDKAEGSNDAYRVYASREESTSDLISLLSRKYPKALEAKSPLDFAKALKEGGYATDPAYVEKFVSVANRLAGNPDRAPLPAPAPAAAAPATGRSLEGLYAAAQGPRPPKSQPMNKVAAAVAQAASGPGFSKLPDTPEAFLKRSVQEEEGVKQVLDAAGQSLRDIAQAQFSSTLSGALMRRWMRPDYEPDNSVVTEEELVGFTEEEQDAIREGTSKAERDNLRFELQDTKDQQRESMKSGTGWGIAGALVAGLPEGAAVGVGTALMLSRLGVGSLALAQQGRRAAAFGSAVVENVGAGLAMTAVQDHFTPDMHIEDYAIGALGDAVLGVLPTTPRILRDSAAAAEHAKLQQMLTDAVDARTRAVNRARAELGPDATPAEVNAAVRKAQAEEVKTTVRRATAVSADRKLIDDETNAMLEADDAEAKPEVAQPTAMEFPSLVDERVSQETGLASDLLNTPYNGTGVLRENALGRDLRKTYGTDELSLARNWDPSDPSNAGHIAKFRRMYGLSVTDLDAVAKPAAVTVVQRGRITDEQLALAEWLHKTFLPDVRLGLFDLDATPSGKAADYAGTAGDAWNVGRDLSVIRFRPDSDHWQHTLVHEFGHVIFDRNVHSLRDSLSDGFKTVHNAWLGKYTNSTTENPPKGFSRALEAAVTRGPSYSESVKLGLFVKGPEGFIPSLMDVMTNVVNRATGELQKPTVKDLKFGTQYIPNLQEFSAEQFTKYIEAALADVLDWKPVARELDPVRRFFAKLYQDFATLFNRVKQAGLLAPDQRVVDFFEAVRKNAKATITKRKRMDQGLDPKRDFEEFNFEEPIEAPGGPSAMATLRTDDDIAREYGIDLLRSDTPAQKAEQKAMVGLWKRAEQYATPSKERLSKLYQTAAMRWAAPTATTLLSSKNAVARMVASELLEHGAGAGGRRTSAALSKFLHERQYMGNSINDFQRHYKEWRNANGGSLREDTFGGERWTEFNRRVALELENRRRGRETGEAPAVLAAADVLTRAYDRMRVSQQQLKTPGWAQLPKTSEGYMPHRMSPEKVRSLTPPERRLVQQVLAQQFEGIEGFDAAFSQQLAAKYMDIIQRRATGGYTAPIGVHSAEAADIVQEVAAAMNMSKAEATALAKRVLKGQPKHTRHRLDLDLAETYEVDGQRLQLIDLFETDQITLLRSQAGRVSGEAALVQHGIMGNTGLKLLRRAMADFGPGATNAELEAFDQVASEFLGQPFGNQGGKWIDRALTFNSLASLGGVGFNQLAETLNGAVTLGVRHAFASVGGLRRLRAEVLALAEGKPVNNPIIGSIELHGGAEFGTDHYKLVFPFDNQNRGAAVYGTEDITAMDRLLRGGAHLQGKLSLWRAITSAQERGFAEQIVLKSLRYIREGKEDKALADMGIDPGLAAVLRRELPRVARFDSNGRVVSFDVTRMEDQAAAAAYVQAVHRGTKQIIQGAFIGETGKWAHSGLLKLATQFRTFSLIAIDKQWNRVAGNEGTAKALGWLLGTMTLAAPIVMVRASIASLGRPDQQEYLERRLAPGNIARETLNYTALAGLSGDLLDVLSAVSGFEPTGGRSGSNKSLVGNVVAPAVGKVNDIWGALQNSAEGTNIHPLVQQLPFARLPWLYPAVNSLKPE